MTTKEIIEKAGGISAVARACKISKQAVFKWNEVPPRRCKTLEKLSGIPKELIRPDIY